MAYQVTIYSEAEKAACRKDVAENGVPAGDLAYYQHECVTERASKTYEWLGLGDRTRVEKKEAGLTLSFAKPRTNLMKRAEWISLLKHAVLNCKRADGNGRGLKREEFLALVGQSFDQAEERITEWEGRGVKRSEQLKEVVGYNSPIRGEHGGITVRYGRTGQFSGGLFHKELIELRKALGW
jgi:hypothetical protein